MVKTVRACLAMWAKALRNPRGVRIEYRAVIGHRHPPIATVPARGPLAFHRFGRALFAYPSVVGVTYHSPMLVGVLVPPPRQLFRDFPATAQPRAPGIDYVRAMNKGHPFLRITAFSF